MNLYEVLGVEPSADAAEVRRAYLRLARAHHPDRHAGDAGRQRAAEDRMRSVNAAWHVLGDPARRAAYDRRGEAPGGAGPAPRSGRPPGPWWGGGPTPGWRPYDEGEDPDPADLDDTPVGAWRPPAWTSVAPAVLVLVAVALVGTGFVLASGRILVVAVAVAILAALLFVLAPVRAMLASQAADHAAERRREL